MNNSPKKILVLAPHTDDGELGCGGSIHKYKEQGCEVFYAAFSTCSESVPSHLASDILTHEVKKACGSLGIDQENLKIFDFRVRRFDSSRQEILEEMIRLRKEIEPELVLMPSIDDMHQDHAVIAAEGLRAFKNSSVLSYELPWNNNGFNSRCFIRLSEKNILAKINALGQYGSQNHRSYMQAEYIRSLAVSRGVQAGAPFAEAFEVVRWML
jgi:LmbE family N-acetylglucosaminyl deacetylase